VLYFYSPSHVNISLTQINNEIKNTRINHASCREFFSPFSRCRRFSPPDQDLFGWTCRSTVLPGPPCQIVASPVKSRRATELSSVRARSSESVDVAPDRPPPRLYGIALVLCVPFLLCRIASAAIARRERIPAATMESRRKKAERITSAAPLGGSKKRERAEGSRVGAERGDEVGPAAGVPLRWIPLARRSRVLRHRAAAEVTLGKLSTLGCWTGSIIGPWRW
jgi:hypothetical protein